MKVHLLFASFAFIFLASCSSTLNSGEVTLTDARLQEKREFQEEAIRSIDLPLEGDWVTVAPGVLTRTVTHDDGGVSQELQASGLLALEWVGTNVWQPRISEIEAALAAQAELTTAQIQKLNFEREQLRTRMGVLNQWRRFEAAYNLKAESVTSQSCTPSARASARPTTASVGAKASASARTCTQGKTAFARAVVEPPYAIEQSWAPPGYTAFASEVAYGVNCSSAGLADGYPEYADVWYHCP